MFRISLVVSVHFMELQTAALSITKRCAHSSLVVHLCACLSLCLMCWLVFCMLLDASAIWHISSTEAVL